MDIDILVWLGNHRLPFIDWFFTFIVNFSGEIASIAIICLIYWAFDRRFGNRLLFSGFFNILSNQFLKVIFCARRPWIRSERVKPLEAALPEATGYSFPSTHTANSVGLFGIFATAKKRFSRLWWILPVIVGFSRMYVGVHTPQDVLVSFIVGIGIVYFANALENRLNRNPLLDVPIVIIGIGLSAALAVWAGLKNYPDENGFENAVTCLKLASAACGAFIGWFLERRYIAFSTPENVWKGALRFVLGMGLVLLIVKGLKTPFINSMGEYFGNMMRYLLAGLTITCFWPWLFRKFNL